MKSFRETLKEVVKTWQEENPCEDGHDHVTPFDRFFYGNYTLEAPSEPAGVGGLDLELIAEMLGNLRNGDDAYYTPSAVDAQIHALQEMSNRHEALAAPAVATKITSEETERLCQESFDREDGYGDRLRFPRNYSIFRDGFHCGLTAPRASLNEPFGNSEQLPAAGAVPEGWMVELVTNIKRAAIRGRNCVGTPDSAAASNFVATCDHIESLADQVLAAQPPSAPVGVEGLSPIYNKTPDRRRGPRRNRNRA